MHPATKRSWLQTGGLPVEPIHADLRAEFDQVQDVAYIGGACFRLLDRNGRQVGLVQFQGDAQGRVDQAVAATTERLATGQAKPVDIAAGDTLIRPLDMRDPADRVLAENAISGVDAVTVPDAERQDPPPIDLPDYVPTDDDLRVQRAELGRFADGNWIGCAVLFVVVALIVAAYYLGRNG